MTWLLRIFARLAVRHPVLVLTVSVLATVLAAFPAAQVIRNVDNDVTRLMPPDLPATATMYEANTQLGAVDLMVVVVKLAPDLPGALPLPWEDASAEDLGGAPSADLSSVTDPKARTACEECIRALARYRAFRRSHRKPVVADQTGPLPEAYVRACDAYEAAAEALLPEREERLLLAEDYADILGPLLEESPLVQSVDYRISSELKAQLAEHFGERILLYLEEPELGELRRRLGPEGLRERLRHGMDLFHRDRRRFKERFAPDPLGIAELVEKRTSRYARMAASKPGDEYLVASDGSMLILVVRGLKLVTDLPYTQALVADVERRIEGAWTEFEEADPDTARAARRTITVDLAFNYPAAVYENISMRRDIRRTFAISLVGVLLLFLVVYRRLTVSLLVGLPLVGAVVWTLSVAGLCYDRISVLSGAFGAVLLGLGIDYAIHLYNRYIMERAGGASTADAVERAILSAGSGILLGALTTAVAFYGITVARFRALSELGFLAGTGVLLSLIAMLVTMPAMLMLFGRRQGRREDALRAASPFGFGLAHLARFIPRRPGLLVAATLVLSAAALAHFIASVSGDFVDFDFQKLRSSGNPAFELSQLVTQRFRVDLQRIICVNRGETVDEALKEADALIVDTDPLLQDGSITEVDTILAYVPPRRAQERCVRFLREEVDFDQVIRDFKRACRPVGFRPEAFVEFYDSVGRMEQLANEPQFVALPELESIEAMRPKVERYRTFGPDPNGRECHKVVSFLHPAIRPSTQRWFDRLTAALGEDTFHRSFTAPNLVALELRRLLAEDFSLVTGLVLCLILLVLVWNLWPSTRPFRSGVFLALGRAFLVLMPVVAGILWMLSIMLLLGWTFNQFNIVILPMVIGIGIDDGIHIAHEFRRSGDAGRAVSCVGRAVVMTSLTTIIGFGALVTANSYALYTLGSVAALGIACCMVTSLVALPAFLLKFARVGTNETEAHSDGATP